jgi:hypothetical protein
MGGAARVEVARDGSGGAVRIDVEGAAAAGMRVSGILKGEVLDVPVWVSHGLGGEGDIAGKEV